MANETRGINSEWPEPLFLRQNSAHTGTRNKRLGSILEFTEPHKLQNMKYAADEYAKATLLSNRSWSLHATEDLSDNYTKAKLNSTLETLGNPVAADEIEREFGIEHLDGRDSMIQLGRVLMESLVQDVADCLTEEQLPILRRCEWRMVDIGLTNALCTNQSVDGSELPGFIILINQGLYFCIKLLVTAQIYEDMDHDFLPYRKSGIDVFAAACDLYVSETPDKINVGAIFTGNEDVDGAIEAHVSLGSILLMQFVALHEVGHAQLGHNKAMGLGRLSALSAVGMTTEATSETTSLAAHHAAEFEADAFAWQRLAHRATSPENNLGNIYVIRLFFGFLDAIENKIGKRISEYHPLPKIRAQRLEQLFSPDGLTDQQKAIFDRQDALINGWSEAITYWEK